MKPLAQWRERIVPAICLLKKASGNTEDEFLQIGSHLQDFYLKAREISQSSNQLTDLLRDSDYYGLIQMLQGMIDEIGEYLVATQVQSAESCDALIRVVELLDVASQPLGCFQKMHKTLRMLGISTKIESSRLGEAGIGFTILAMDVEKLSGQVNDKTDHIIRLRQQLERLILENLQRIKDNQSHQNADVSTTLNTVVTSFEGLKELNGRLSLFGEVAGNGADEVAASVSEVVSSMQTHDMVRQQMEHVTEALDKLVGELCAVAEMDDGDQYFPGWVSKVGDVCELQVAHVRHSGAELYDAVVSIIDNLNGIGHRQSRLAEEVAITTGAGSSSGNSYFEDLRNGLTGTGAALKKCSDADRNLLVTLLQVAETINEISHFVGAIEEIGAEIDLLALNAQIKAAHTGKSGAVLGVLAEAIKRLSFEAVSQADAISRTLSDIITTTDNLVVRAQNQVDLLCERVMGIEEKVGHVISFLNCRNESAAQLLTSLKDSVGSLNHEIQQRTSGIEVHQKVQICTGQVVAELEEIVAQARAQVPATSEFYKNLQHMSARYTMQSERRIHEELARINSGRVEVMASSLAVETFAESEFGDNVDLF